MNTVKRSILELNISLIIMGGTTIFPKIINLPVNYIIFGRSAVAALAILLYIKIIGCRLTLKFNRDFLTMAGSGIILGFHWIALFEAIKLSTVSIGILSFFTYPIITVFLEKIFLKSRILVSDIVLGILIILGLSLVFQDIQISSKYFFGVIWGIIAAVTFSLRMIISKKLLEKFSGEETMLYQAAVAAACLLPIVLFHNFTSSVNVDFSIIAGLILLGAVFTALPHTLVIRSLNGLKPKTVSILSSLQPLYCIVVAFIILEEVPTIKVVLGGIIIISSVLFETLRSSKGK